MNNLKYILFFLVLSSCMAVIFIGCEHDDVIRYEATGSLSMDIVSGVAAVNWPSQFNAHITISAAEYEEGGEAFDPIETDVTIRRDSQDTTRWAATELVEVPVEAYVRVSVTANINGITWMGQTYVYLEEDLTQTQEIILEPVASSNQFVEDFGSGSLPSDWEIDGDALEFIASVIDGELHLNAFTDYGTGTAIINRFFNDITHIGYNVRIENNGIEAWGISCVIANPYVQAGFMIVNDISGVTKAQLVELDEEDVIVLDSTLFDLNLNTDYTIDLYKNGPAVALAIDGNTILEYSGAGTLDTSIVFFTTSYCNQIIDDVVINHSGEVSAPGSNNNPPYEPSSPSPSNGAFDIDPAEVALSWAGGDPDGDYVYYYMTWGTDTTMSNYEYPSSNSYTLYELEPSTAYYWQVTSEDDYGEETVGPVWMFVTGIGGGTGWNIGVPPASPSHGDEWTAYMGEDQIPLEMIYIGPGSFQQGAYSGEVGADANEYPQHLVTLTSGFWIGKYEVTQAQWEAVTLGNPSSFSGVNNPVETVSWDHIDQFFLTILNLRDSSGSPWRLPSESEWEYSSRAGTTTRYYWGDDLDSIEIDGYAWYDGNSGSQTYEAGQKLPNAWGLYDMSGNVCEWVEDYYHSDYIGAPTDGSPWLSPTSSSRILRGGSWYNNEDFCRSANRNIRAPGNAYNYFGLRLVRSP